MEQKLNVRLANGTRTSVRLNTTLIESWIAARRAQHSPQANRGELLHELRERVAGLRNEAGATWVQTIETRLSEDILSAILALAPRNPYKAYPVQRINDQQLNALKAAGRD